VKVNILSALTMLVTGGIVTGCSPAQYMVNPPTAVPESEQAGYMRILGDLRWDELTNKEEWMKRFPKCLTDSRWTDFHARTFLETTEELANMFPEGISNIEVKCRDFIVGGIPVNIERVYFAENSGTQTGRMTRKVDISFFNESEGRAFRSALAQKYPLQTMGHCSKYTCYVFDYQLIRRITAEPTPYTISLLDKVQLNKSDL